MNIPEKILENAGRSHGKTAYICGHEKLTYGELAEHAVSLAAFLGEGAPVVIYGHKEPYMIYGILACLICGREYIPCDVSIPEERVISMISISGADTVIGDLPPARSMARIILPEEIGLLPKQNAVSADSENGYIIFTSGSTGVPKGINIPRKSLSSFLGFAEKIYPQAGNIFGGHALFSFDLSVADIFVPLVSGGTFHAFDGQPAEDIEVLTCTPTYLRMCLLSKKFTPENFPELKTVVCCGEKLLPRTAAQLFGRFAGIRLFNAYGPAECCCFVTAAEIFPDSISEELPIGKENFTAGGIEIRDGEIFISGDSAAGHYINGGNGFRDGGFYTGDMGSARGGMIYFNGRKNSGMIKYSGYRIELGEIENVLAEAEGISDCFVTAVTDDHGNVRMIKAFVIADGGLDVPGIKKYLAGKLPQYMIPKVIEKAEFIPHTRNGKRSRTDTVE